ncbi:MULTISPECIES: hypothetical protein [unclassified Microcoleus]|uniref:hypothetical protein n=1 Tax=unclassified Microcoleus TaxID=2642155 RepID=UPI002FCFCE31
MLHLLSESTKYNANLAVEWSFVSVFVNAGQGWRLFNMDEVVNTKTILSGFSIIVNELLA